MLLSLKWLSEYVDIDCDPKEFSEAMTMSGSKVETFFREGDEINNVVVGRVISVTKHPNADSLYICMTDVGQEEPIQIVTAAKNVFPGAMVPVALDGSTVYGGKSIKKGTLRGEISCGMFCSIAELGLTKNDFPYAVEDGIFLIEEDCHVGQDIHEAIGLDDTVVEFEITSNRPDCLSVLGLAREAAATFNRELKYRKSEPRSGVENIDSYLSVDVLEPELCPRYMARMVKDIKIGPSPRWMRERLRASGVRPINNIVDITNYVMLEYGQPMHAFDYKYVKGGKIIVRKAAKGETLTTLDKTVRQLNEDMLVICDEAEPSAVAGVMGGEYSGINDDTKIIVFEAANFFGTSVRKTSKALGMRTESSSRFEKGLDPAACLPAIQRACELVEELGAGTIINGIIDVDNSSKELRRIPLESDWINRFIGIDLSKEKMQEILGRLEFRFEGEDVIVPSFRSDIEHKADISEEIARFYGYDKIPVTTLSGLARGIVSEREKFEKNVVSVMMAEGYSEVMTYTFISPKYYDQIGLDKDDPHRNSLRILNPLGEDTSIMRTTSIPSMLEVLARNYNNRNLSAAMFENAVVYIPTEEDELPAELKKLTIGLYGEKEDFYTLKGAVEGLLRKIRVKNYSFTAVNDTPMFHPGRCASVSTDGIPVGIIGEIHPDIAENYGFETRVYIAVLDMNTMYENRSMDESYRPLPKYPAITRDIAVVCDEDIEVMKLENAISASVGDILERIELFDVYRGIQLGQGKKSVAFSLSFRSPERTLTDADADSAMKNALKALGEIGAVLRA